MKYFINQSGLGTLFVTFVLHFINSYLFKFIREITVIHYKIIYYYNYFEISPFHGIISV